jgi:hypothetical protein
MPGTRTQPTVGILTCSYRGDFEPCLVLCRSVDRFAPEIEHWLVVPRADVALFAPLASSRRRVIAAEDVQPSWLINLPMPGPKWRKRLFLPRREVLLSLKSLPVRGWIAQQLRKLIVVHDAPFDIVLLVDSDNVFFRPLTLAHLVRDDGKIRFFRNPGASDVDTHHKWHQSAARLLGLPPTNYFGADYIDPFIVWQPKLVAALAKRISETTGADWLVALARTPHFAEYILYGVFADHVFEGDPGHYPTSQSLGFARWLESFSGEEDERQFLAAMRPHHVACNLQSTLGMTTEHRERMLAQLIELGREQEATIQPPPDGVS